MNFPKPVIVYTAATNIEAHMIVDMLQSNGVPAQAVEDQSGASLWAFGAISQFHKPNIWVDESTIKKAADLIQGFEEKRRARNKPVEDSGEVQAVCEDCGKTTVFPAALDGTTQECRHCHALVDVGEFSWDDDFDAIDD